jgi:hypothetical protein
MEQYKTSVETTNAVLAYLSERPYKEVNQLIRLIEHDYALAMQEIENVKAAEMERTLAAIAPTQDFTEPPKRKYVKSGKYSKKEKK